MATDPQQDQKQILRGFLEEEASRKKYIDDLRKEIRLLDDSTQTHHTHTLALKRTNDIQKKLVGSTTEAQKRIEIFQKTLVTGHTPERASAAAKALNHELQGLSGVMSDFSKQGLRKQYDSYKQAFEKISGDKSLGGEAAGIHGAMKAVQERILADTYKSEIARGKAISGAGKIIQGSLVQHLAEAAEKAHPMASKIGSMLGLTTDAIGGLAKGIGTFAAFKTAIDFVFGGITADVKGSIAAGNQQSATYAKVLWESAKYNTQLSIIANTSGLGEKRLQEMNQTVFELGGRSRGFTTQFSADIGRLGMSMGMGTVEAAKLGTRIGVLARSGMRQTTFAFAGVASEAERLRMPMESLVDPMMALAEVEGRTGGSAITAAKALHGFVGVVEGLASNKTLKMFQAMSGADISKFAGRFVEVLSKIDDVKLAAMSYKPGEGIGSMVSRVTGMGTSGRLDAVKNIMQRFGLTGQNPKNQWYLGSMVTGNPSDMQGSTAMGAFLQKAVNRHWDDARLTKEWGSEIDKKMSQRISTGEMIARGEDPLMIITSLINRVIKVLELIAGAPLLAAGGTLNEAAIDRRLGVTDVSGKEKSTYGHSAVEAKRFPVR